MRMFQLLRTKAFDRDVKNYITKGGNLKRLADALHRLHTNNGLPPWFRDHILQGKLRHCCELHVEPDWLLVYQKDGKRLRILCLWLVSHKKLQERERSL